jgi:hypothetical protein
VNKADTDRYLETLAPIMVSRSILHNVPKPCSACGILTILRWKPSRTDYIPVTACSEFCARGAAVERRAKEYEK